MKYIQKIDTFVIDGTFISSHQGFYQLLVINGHIFKKKYPFKYILLSSKSEISYTRPFKKCNGLVEMNVKNIVTGFERALENGYRAAFQTAECHGCLFHLVQAIWMGVGALGEIPFYKNDVLYKKVIKMMLCLTFIPSKDVLKYYEEIMKLIETENIHLVENFGSYFEKVYLGLNEGGR